MFPLPVANRKYRFQTGNRSKNDVSVSKTPKSVYFSILNLFPIFSYTFANWKYLVQTGRMILSRKFQIGVILNFQSICGVSKTKLNLRFRRIFFFRCQQELRAFLPAFSNGSNRKMVSEVTRGDSTKNQSKNCIERCERLRREVGPPIASNKARG